MKRHSLVTANHMLRVGHITRAIVSRLYLDALIHVDSSRREGREERRAAHGIGLIHELAAIITAGKLTNSKALLLKQVAGGNRVGIGRPQLDWARMLVDPSALSLKQVAGENRVGRIKGEMSLDQIATILSHADVVGWAGLLHDIGKLVVPKGILATWGALSDSAFNQIRVHPEAGIELLPREWVEGPEAGEGSRSRGTEFGRLVRVICGGHHVRPDRTGYGELLENLNPVEQIALDSAKMADTFVALRDRTHGRTSNGGQRTHSLAGPGIRAELLGDEHIGLYLRNWLGVAGVNALDPLPLTEHSQVWSGQLN